MKREQRLIKTPIRRFGGMVDGYGLIDDAGNIIVERGAFNGIETYGDEIVRRINSSSQHPAVIAGWEDRSGPEDVDVIVTAEEPVNSHEKLIEGLRGLFEHCAMVHKHWGEGSNQKEADAAIAAARAALEAAEAGTVAETVSD